MLLELSRLRPRLIVSASQNPRAADPYQIAAAGRELGLETMVVDGIGPAVLKAQGDAGHSGIVCVTGSLYVVAEARESLGLADTPDYERALLYG